MMVPKKSLLLASSAILFAGSVSAQQQDTPMMRRVTQPLHSATLDLETGTVTRERALSEKGAPGFTTSSALSNNDFSGFVGIDSGPGTPNGPCEWIVAANKGDGAGNAAGNNVAQNAGGKSGLVTLFAFAYCSAALDTASGGVGGFARIGFREGYALGGGTLGTDVGTFNLSGLPAWTGCSSFFGGFACFLIGVTFGTTPLVLNDGPIGYSYQFRDLGTDGVLAKTFPFLSCVQSCTSGGAGSAGYAGPDAMGGMVNFVDQYCPAGSLTSSFTFATAPNGNYYTSVSMDIREIDPISASTADLGCVGNPSILTHAPAVWDGAAFNFDTTLDCTGFGNSLALWRLAFAPPPPPLPSKWGTICVAITAGTGLNLPAAAGAPPIFHGGGVAVFSGPVPQDSGLLGACWQLQGFCGNSSGTGQLSQAIVNTMGTE